ncbi:S-layer homology domain-containing protein [Symbiobacterium terraclitae]|uniref:S-layer homology domain-containing protein n=1 Tax=Symbiobacterium terraclitae TaxID=557451 RepID=UPI0035B532AB
MGSVIRADATVTVALEDQKGGSLALEVVGLYDGRVDVRVTQPLERGDYTLVVTVDGTRFTAPIRVEVRPRFEGISSSQPASYAGQTVTLHGGDRWTFSATSMPLVEIQDLNRNGQVVAAPVLQLVSDKEIRFEFPAGLPSGRYQIVARMDESYTTGQYIYIGLDLEPALRTGVPEQTITATAAGVTFDAGTTVSIEAAGVTVSDVRVLDDPHQIQFTVRGQLPFGFVTVLVTRSDGYEIQHREFLSTPGLPWRAALTDWNGAPMAGVMVYISPANEYPVKSFGFTTDAAGEFALALPPGQYIVNWWQGDDGRRQRTYLPFTMKLEQTEYALQLPRPNVTVRVQYEGGTAAPDAVVLITGLSEADPLRGNGIDTRVDASGVAQLYLPPAEYEVNWVRAEGYLHGERVRFQVGPDGEQEVTVVLPVPNMRGTLRFAGEESGPVSWASLWFYGEGGRFGLTTDEQGRFADRLAPGQTYHLAEVVLTAEQGATLYYFGERYPVAVAEDDTPVTLDVELPAANVRGEAQVSGKAVAEGELRVRHEDSGRTLSVPIHGGGWQAYLSDGKYSITGIRVNGSTHKASVTVTVTDGKADRTDIVVKPVSSGSPGSGGGSGSGGDQGSDKPPAAPEPEQSGAAPGEAEAAPSEAAGPEEPVEPADAAGGDNTVVTDQGTLTEAAAEDGTTSVSLALDPEKVAPALSEGDLLVDLSGTDADARSVSLPVDLLDEMRAADRSLVLRTGVADLVIPASLIAPAALPEEGARLQITVAALEAPAAAGVQNQGIAPAGGAVRLEAALVGFRENGQAVTRFTQPVTLILPIAETADPRYLGIYRLDPESGTWTYIGGRVDAEQGVIAATLWSFSEYAVMAYTRTFPDVADDHWARTEIQVMAARHIAGGDEAGLFHPDSPVTRAEFAALMVRALGLQRVAPEKSSFTDVASTDWFYGDVETAAAAGLIQGFAGQFRPQDQISRQEMAAVLARGLRRYQADLLPEAVEGLPAGLADRDEIASWAAADVALVYQLGLVKGRSETSYAPLATATRAEAVVILKRLLEVIGEL